MIRHLQQRRGKGPSEVAAKGGLIVRSAVCTAFSGVKTDAMFAATEEQCAPNTHENEAARPGTKGGCRHQARNVSFSSGESQPRPRVTGDSKRLLGRKV